MANPSASVAIFNRVREFCKSPKVGWLVLGATPLKKYESQMGSLFPIDAQQNVPKHQPLGVFMYNCPARIRHALWKFTARPMKFSPRRCSSASEGGPCHASEEIAESAEVHGNVHGL